MAAAWHEAEVECYAGYTGGETPRSVTVSGARLAVLEVVRRGRALDAATGRRLDRWRVRLSDGRSADLERDEDGRWRIRTPDRRSD